MSALPPAPVLASPAILPGWGRVGQDEVIAVRHSHLRQGLRVHHVLGANDLVEMQEVGCHGVYLVVGQRLRLRVRHRSAEIVEHRSRIGPVAPNGAHGALAGERTLPTNEWVVRPPGALLAVARLALLGIHDGALLWGAAPQR